MQPVAAERSSSGRGAAHSVVTGQTVCKPRAQLTPYKCIYGYMQRTCTGADRQRTGASYLSPFSSIRGGEVPPSFREARATVGIRSDLSRCGAVCGAPVRSEFGICPRREDVSHPPCRANLITVTLTLTVRLYRLSSTSCITSYLCSRVRANSPSESLLLVLATPVESKVSEANRTSRRNVATRRHLQASQRLFSLRP